MGKILSKRIVLATLVVIVASFSAHALPPNGAIPGEVVLRFAPEANPDSVLQGTGASLSDSIANVHTFLASFSPSIPVDTMVTRLRARIGVLKVQPNFKHELPEILQMSQSFPDQNAPTYVEDVSPTTYYEQPATSMINADSAALLSGGEDVIVAIIDNGIDMLHPAFEGSISPDVVDFVEDDMYPDDVPGEMFGHGTFVAGIVKLIAPHSQLLPIRAFDSAGVATTFSICQSIYWAIDHNADVINMSFSLYSNFPVIDDAIEDAFQAGIVMVAAAGNDGEAVSSYPAGHDGVISVAALDSLEQLADFSNYGDNVDICAPGVYNYSALAGDYDWGRWSGTSFSAPLAAGVCALILSRDPEATPGELHCHLRTAARTDFQWGSITPPDSVYGYGCLDAFHSVLAYSFGDMDVSGEINLVDIAGLISFIYLDGPPSRLTESIGDFNCDGKYNLIDVAGMIGYVYLGGREFWPCYRY